MKKVFSLFVCAMLAALSLTDHMHAAHDEQLEQLAREYSALSDVHVAAAHGMVRWLHELLEQGNEPINGTDDYGMTPLHYAVLNGNIDATRELLEHGANIQCIDNVRCTPLHYAVVGDPENRVTCSIVDVLVREYKADYLCENEISISPLYAAVRTGNIAIVQCLLDCADQYYEGCSDNAFIKNEGIKLFDYAVLHNQAEMAEYIACRMNSEVCTFIDEHKPELVEIAYKLDAHKSVDHLMQQGVNLDACKQITKEQFLHLMLDKGSELAVSHLALSGADLSRTGYLPGSAWGTAVCPCVRSS